MPQDKITHYIFANTEDTTHALVDLSFYKVGYFIAKCAGSEGQNEDSLIISFNEKKDELTFAVSDGAGGHPKGADASRLTVEEIKSFVQSDKDTDPISLIENINNKVQEMKVGARCTLSLAQIKNNHIRFNSVGDSEILYWNANSSEVYKNIPDSDIGHLIHAGAIEQDKSLDDSSRYLVSNLIGDKAVRIESTTSMELKKGHTILMGSDGLFDNLSHVELASVIAAGSIEESFQKLVNKCIEQNEDEWKKHDDISFIVIRKIQNS